MPPYATPSSHCVVELHLNLSEKQYKLQKRENAFLIIPSQFCYSEIVLHFKHSRLNDRFVLSLKNCPGVQLKSQKHPIYTIAIVFYMTFYGNKDENVKCNITISCNFRKKMSSLIIKLIYFLWK